MSTTTVTKPKNAMMRKAVKARRVSWVNYVTKRLLQIEKALKGASSEAYILRLKKIRKTLKASQHSKN